MCGAGREEDLSERGVRVMTDHDIKLYWNSEGMPLPPPPPLRRGLFRLPTSPADLHIAKSGRAELD